MIIATAFICSHCQNSSIEKIFKADVIVYGGTSSAVTAAAQVARMLRKQCVSSAAMLYHGI